MAGLASALIAFGAAVAASAALSAVAAVLPLGGFMALVLGAVALWLPALCIAILFGLAPAAGSLVLLAFPVLAWGWRRLPRGQWRTARALGASPSRIVRVLILPAMAPFLLAAVLLAGSILAVRAQLDATPRPVFLPDPVTATG